MTTTTTPTGRGEELASRPLARHRTVDLMVTVAIGVAFGIAFLGYGALYTLLTPLTTLFPPSVGILAGIWFLPAVLAGLIVRRPGAALLAEVIAAVVEMMLGAQWGWATVVSGLIQGGGVELVFALTAYRRFRLPVAIAAGMVAAAFEWVYERFFYYQEFSTAAGLWLLLLFLVSGALLAGLLGWGLTRALAATGALNAFPPGREHARAHRV
ncbi:ECF transporter S component [Brachybacterium sp. EF45031]|uniref:ECF transporter S component n=1 Tax=Brachybacterium sillae TaxID=2810536 RepID=UPI00217E6C1E|nr:ECF transporter S component [Brachybacterium sillae]MCS6712517.1 ECF transporter S component [Brachybacterium sillae]